MQESGFSAGDGNRCASLERGGIWVRYLDVLHPDYRVQWMSLQLAVVLFVIRGDLTLHLSYSVGCPWRRASCLSLSIARYAVLARVLSSRAMVYDDGRSAYFDLTK